MVCAWLIWRVFNTLLFVSYSATTMLECPLGWRCIFSTKVTAIVTVHSISRLWPFDPWEILVMLLQTTYFLQISISGSYCFTGWVGVCFGHLDKSGGPGTLPRVPCLQIRIVIIQILTRNSLFFIIVVWYRNCLSHHRIKRTFSLEICWALSWWGGRLWNYEKNIYVHVSYSVVLAILYFLDIPYELFKSLLLGAASYEVSSHIIHD